ncbi:MAG: autotransporter outer membrane beta-barrel domain-containing protein, partial [Verrucomicrobiales bacterium]|nr:autotransporter outer membrane beta-barrel domain-containing protein [Verrucomicrobiales bacterium]
MNPTIPHPSRLRVFVTGVKKLTLLLTLLCALSVSALNVFAENKVVTTGTVTESDKTYESVSDTAALFVTGSESSYSGTAITLIGTTNSGFAIYSGAAYLFSSTILNPSDTTGSIGTVNLNGTLHVYDSIAQGNHGGMAVIGEKSKLIADNFVVTTATTLAINIYYAGTAELRNSRVTVITDGGDGTVIGMWTNGTLKGDNLQVIHAGADGTGIINGGGGPIMLTNSEITASTGIVSLFSTISINLENTRINAGTGLDLRDTGDITIIGGAINSAGGNALLASSTARYDITISDHAAITGGITNTASGTLNVNLDASTLAGDIANTGGGTLTIILDNDSVGAGAFTGGNLIIGSDSAWNFTKDSAADLIDNHGVIHLGTPDHYIALRSDTISGDGTWFFPVNSDTGAKSTVTGSTAADSHPRGKLIVSGDGLRDPNSVVNTLVTGLNKENWIWDNFNWGLEEYTQDGHDADGNPHFIQRGTSPAGTVLNSAIAIQQAMWFAQQDSLLKRLGELRYGTRASRPPAGGTPALHNLIDNLWLRSYGQQLNVGGKVSGQAYEQLIYGVDLGTDHKFIISADSDLYLGVYAGYGRSDIDYRTPGTDGELNSSYGGLYATWLHSSGFYLDATVKAASVD